MSPITLCKVYLNGPHSHVMTLPKNLRAELGIVSSDVLGFRVIEWQGKKMLLGEKIPLSKIASLKTVEAEVVPQAVKAVAEEAE